MLPTEGGLNKAEFSENWGLTVEYKKMSSEAVYVYTNIRDYIKMLKHDHLPMQGVLVYFQMKISSNADTCHNVSDPSQAPYSLLRHNS